MLTLYISVFVFNVVAIFMKKRLSSFEYYGSIFFGIFVAELTDRFTEWNNTYYFFKPSKIVLKSLWVMLGIYPAAIMLIINWYPYNKSWSKKVLYILAWSAFSTFFEWISLKSGYLHYTTWKLWYSAIMYPFMYSGLILNVYFIRWLNKKAPLL